MHYRLMMLTSAAPNFYPETEPAPRVATPPIEGTEGTTITGEAKPEEMTAEQLAAKADADAKAAKPEPKVETELTPEQKAQAAKDAAKVDPPVIPEAYELKVEGVDLDPKAVEAATPIFKEAGLTQEQAQAVVSHYAKDVLPSVAQTVQQDTLKLLGMDGLGAWAAAIKTDKELGGADYEKNLTVIAAGRDAVSSPELRAFLETSRIGNHPEIARLFFKVGKAIAEGGVFHGNRGAGGAGLTPEQRLYGAEFQPKS